MKLTRLIVVGLMALAVIGAGVTPPPFPFETYASVPVVTGSGQPSCENGGIVYQIGDGRDWRVISWKDRDLFIHFGADGQADWAYLTVDKGDGKIRVARVIPAAEARMLYPSGCEYGDERSA
jgi:hypothetical protein